MLQTSRPLMSLMLPAVVSNNSSDSNQSDTVAMMKIDCQVKRDSVFQLPE